MDQEARAKAVQDIVDRLMQQCYDAALVIFKQEASQVTGGSVYEYAKGTWKAILGTDVAEVVFSQLAARIAGFRGGAGIGMGIVFDGTYRALRRHLTAAWQLLQAQARYEKARENCVKKDWLFREQARTELGY